MTSETRLRVGRTLQLSAAALLVTAALAACGDESDEPPRQGPTQGEPSESAPDRELRPRPSPQQVAGIAVSVSDVEGEPDGPMMGDVWALAVPAALEAALWEDTLSRGAPADERLPFASAAIDVELLTKQGAVVAAVGTDGHFALDVDADDYVMCVVTGDAEPTSMQGCGRVTLEPGATVVLSRGEEGTLVRRADDGDAD